MKFFKLPGRTNKVGKNKRWIILSTLLLLVCIAGPGTAAEFNQKESVARYANGTQRELEGITVGIKVLETILRVGKAFRKGGPKLYTADLFPKVK